MTRRKDGGPVTSMGLRRAGFVLERNHDDLGADVYHDFVFLGRTEYRDFLGRDSASNSYTWMRLICNNPDCTAVALRRSRAVEAEVNLRFAYLLRHP